MPIQLKRNDTKDTIGYAITNADGTPVNLTGAAVRFIMGKGKTLITNAAATIVNAAAGTVEYTLTDNDTLEAGVFNAEFEVTFSDGKIKTYPNNGYIKVNIQANIDKDFSTYIEDQIAYRVSDLQVLKNGIQAQLDQFAKGDSAPEVAQARVEADGTTNATLKARLDKKESEFKTFKDSTTTQLAQKATKQELANIADGSPKGTYDTFSALQTALPTGGTGVYVVSADGKWYYWSGSAWSAGGQYQSTGIADEEVTLEKTFEIIQRSANFFDPLLITTDNNLDTATGGLVGNGNYVVSDYIPIKGLGGRFFCNINNGNACFYTKEKTFISGLTNIVYSTGRTIPSSAYYMRVSFAKAFKDTEMLSITTTQLSAAPTFVPYVKEIKGLRPDANLIDSDAVIAKTLDKSIRVNKLKDLSVTRNVFDPNGLIAEIVNADGTFTTSAASMRTDFIPIKANQYYGHSAGVTAYFYDKNLKFLYSQGNVAFTTNRRASASYPTTAFVVFCSTNGNMTFKDTNGNPMMAIISDTAIGTSPTYTPFGYKLGNDVVVTKSDKTNIDFLAPKTVYTVYNDINTSRQLGARIYLDHLFPIVTADETARFRENNADFWGITPPDNNNNVNVATVTKDNYIDSEKYVTKKVSVTQRSVKASVGSAKRAVVLFIGDSMSTKTTLQAFSDKIKGGKFPYFGYVKELFEMDKIDNGNTGFNVEFCGGASDSDYVDVPIDYNGVSRTVRAGGVGYGGYGITTMMNHPYRLDPSSANWTLLGLDVSTGQAYTGTQAQMDLIRSTPLYGYTGGGHAFYDKDVVSGKPFSIAKYLQRYRTRDDNGNKLALGAPTLGTEITTQAQIDNWYIATPTHIVLQHGRNDETYPSAFNAAVQDFITKVQAELPTVKIGIAIPADAIGTMFPSRYPNIVGTNGKGIAASASRLSAYGIANTLLTNYSNLEGSSIFLIPNYFVQPTGWSNFLKATDSLNDDSFDSVDYINANNDYSHPSYRAHKAWAYQYYAWLKYTLV